jgi:acyl-coenzyme A thioesterase PaaI-like protein
MPYSILYSCIYNMPSTTQAFIQLMKHPVKNRLFLFSKLPAAFFSGVRIREVSEQQCEVTVPYKWFSQNPFRSTYFACLAMAAELTTGSLAMVHIYKRTPAVSMLIVKMEASYFKKATGITTFTCADGTALKETVEKAIATGEAQSFTALSTGLNAQGEKVAEFLFTWSFKAKP